MTDDRKRREAAKLKKREQREAYKVAKEQKGLNSSAGSNSSTPVTKPKKRGRPTKPKRAIESDSSESSITSTSTKRSRGRPQGASNIRPKKRPNNKRGPSTRLMGCTPFSNVVADGILARIGDSQFLNLDDSSDDDTSTIDNTQNETITRNKNITQNASAMLNFDNFDDDDETQAEIDERIPSVIPSQELMPPPRLPYGRSRNRNTAATRAVEPLRRSIRILENQSRIRPCKYNPSLHQRTNDFISKHRITTVQPPKLNGPPNCRTRHAGFGCASLMAKHKISQHNSGGFTYKCKYCNARLLKRECEDMQHNRWAKCCSYGQVNSDRMREEYEELMNPPPVLKDLTTYMEDMNYCENFLMNTLPLNNSFAFGSVTCGKADPNDREAVGSRKDTCKLNGEFTFRLSDLYCAENKGQRPLFGQTYCLDPDRAIDLREENFTDSGLPIKVKRDVIKLIEKMVREYHPFAQAYQSAHQRFEEVSAENKRDGKEMPQFRLTLLTNRELRDQIFDDHPDITLIHNNEPIGGGTDQVAVIWISDDGIHPKCSGSMLFGNGDGRTIQLQETDPNIEPACFPLLHPKGTQGYRFGLRKAMDGRTIRRRTSANPTVRDEQAMDEDLEKYQENSFPLDIGDDNVFVRDFDSADHEAIEEEEETVEDPLNKAPVFGEPPELHLRKKKKKKGEAEKNISMRQFARYRTFIRDLNEGNKKIDKDREFHWLWTMRKLAEYFLISVLNRVEHNEMSWVKENQKNLRVMLAKDYMESLQRGLPAAGTLGEVFFTPATLQGSRQYYQKSYANLMTLCRKLGNPTWFVTFTGNPTWPEIELNLAKGQEYSNRADIVCRIFIDKAKEFIRDVTERGVLGKVAGWCYSVEHQKRGMPHIHLLLILDKDANPGLGTPEFVDQYISARIPNLPRPNDITPEAEQQRRLWNAVTKMNLHDCDDKAPCRSQRVDRNGVPISVCNKRFPKDYTPQTVLSAVRYTQYTRLRPDDQLDPAYEDVNADLDPDNREPFGVPGRKVVYEDEDGQRFEDGQPRIVQVVEDINADNDPDNSTQYERIPAEKGGNVFYKMSKNKQIRLTDANVVPYNEFLLLKYGCHINIEYVFGQKACKYIFKYILKGHEKAYIKLNKKKDGQDVYDFDEIAATFKVRYMTSMEAYLRLFGYPIVQNSHLFATMPVVIPDTEIVVFEEGQEGNAQRQIDSKKNNKVTGFFEICGRGDEDSELARTKRYHEIEEFFWWDKNRHQWVRRKRAINNMMIRVYTVSPKNAKLFAARALLLHKKGPRSYEELCTPEGENEPCRDANGQLDYITAAKKENLLTNPELIRDTIRDAIAEKMSQKRLQGYFAALIFHQNPANAKELFEEFLDEMVIPNMNVNEEADRRSRKQTALKYIQYWLIRAGSSCEMVGLDTPLNYNHEAVAEQMEQDELINVIGGDREVQQPQQFWQKLADKNVEKLTKNTEQQDAYKKIIASLTRDWTMSATTDMNKQRLFFLEGAGGCGKTFIYNTLIAQMRASKRKVVSCASTAIAALLLMGGQTAHRAFRIPTKDFGRDTQPRFSSEKPDAHYLRDTELIIIDEVSMLHRDVLDFIDRTLRSILPCEHPYKHIPFGGKTVVLGGDWKQLLPVVVGGNKFDQIEASLLKEPIFGKFKWLRLIKNMRVEPGQQEFCKWLSDVGMGRNSNAAGNITIPKENTVNRLEDLLEFTFMDFFKDSLDKSQIICDAAILTPRNDGVEEINRMAMNKMPGEAKIYHSIDQPLPSGELLDHMDVYAADFNIEAVNQETPSGMPPHELALKVGAPIMIIRNYDVFRGLCNGTRLQIVRMTEHNLICRVLTGPNRSDDDLVFIPKITIKYGEGSKHRGLRFERYQFPVRPCFAMTNNKAQGQTLKRVGLALNRQQCFAHGQVYVAVSRVTTMAGLKVFSTLKSNLREVKNIVYKEVLRE